MRCAIAIAITTVTIGALAPIHTKVNCQNVGAVSVVNGA